MAGLVLDFTNVSSGFEDIPEGVYEGEIKKVELKNTKAGDSQYLNIEWGVMDENGKEKKVWDICSLKPQTLWKLKDLLIATGMSADGSIELDTEEMVGQTCNLELKIDTYEGKEKNVVKSYKGFRSDVATTDAI